MEMMKLEETKPDSSIFIMVTSGDCGYLILTITRTQTPICILVA